MASDSELPSSFSEAPGWARKLVAAAVIVAILSAAWLGSGASTEQPGWQAGAIGPQLLCAVVVIVALGVASSGVVQPRTRLAWLFLAVAFGLRGAGEAIRGWTVMGALPEWNAWAEIGFIAHYPALLLGVLLLPSATRSRVDGARWGLDAGILLAAGTTLVWFLALHAPVLRPLGADYLLTPALGYAVGDLLLVLCTVTLLQRRLTRVRRGTETLLVTGLAVGLASNLLQAALSGGAPPSTTVPSYALWTLTYVLVAMAALRQFDEPTAASNDPVETAGDGGLIPWISALGIYGMLAFTFAPAASTRDLGVLMGVIVVTGLILLRQVMARREHLRLADAAAERRSEARFQALVQQSSDLLLLVDAAGVIRFASASASRVLGTNAEALLGARYLQIVHPDDTEEARGFLNQRRDGSAGSAPVTWRLRHADGRWLPVENMGVGLLHDASVRGIVLNARDVSERQALQAELMRQAFEDALTGLANRTRFHKETVAALRNRKRSGGAVAVLFIDLDDFKSVNDTLGHAAGDALLKEVSERLLNATRGCDTVARLGGDEFAILLERLPSIDDALVVTNRALAALTRPIVVEGREVYTPGSVGIALAEPDDDADTLLRNADLAMYMAKRGGRGRYVIFESSMHSAALKRMEMEADLRHAISRNELELRYQPIVDLETGVMISIETLLRWRHPQRGLLAPLGFIPLAEETGMIVSIGRWVLHEACMQAAEWRREQEQAKEMSIAVNVSARQIQDPSLVRDVQSALARAGLPPGALVLEITESVMMYDTETALQRFRELKSLGVRLAVDDFGTGYSSLAYLKRFPVDILKIDKAFVDGVGDGADEAVLTNAIVSLGSTLSLRTVAEGIEQPQQLARLQALGCNLGQGFLFSRPVRAEQVSALLRGEKVAEMDEIDAELVEEGYEEEAPT